MSSVIFDKVNPLQQMLP